MDSKVMRASWHPSALVCPEPLRTTRSGNNWLDSSRFMVRRSYSTNDLVADPELYYLKEHERAHWFQTAGTSLGTFLMLLKRSSILQAISVLSMPARGFSIEELFLRRIPPVLVDPRGCLDFDHLSKLGEAFGTAMELYHCMLVERLIMDAPQQWHINYNRKLALTSAMMSVGKTHAYYTGGAENNENLRTIAAQIRDTVIYPVFVDLSAGISAQRRVELSTRHIMECSAILAEFYRPLRAYRGKPLGGRNFVIVPEGQESSVAEQIRSGSTVEETPGSAVEYIEKRLAGLASDPGGDLYLSCIDHAYKVLSPLHSSSCRVGAIDLLSETLSICCDLSLNMPCHPFQSDLHGDFWGNFYPPSRFIKLLNSVLEVGLYSGSKNGYSFSEYCSELLQVAQISICTMPASSIIPQTKFNTVYLKEASISQLASTLPDQFPHVLWCCAKLHSFRAKFPEAACMPQTLSGRVLTEMFDSLEGTLNCPFIWRHDLNVGARELPMQEDYFVFAMIKQISDEIVRQLVLGRPYKIDLIPYFPAHWYDASEELHRQKYAHAFDGMTGARFVLANMADEYGLPMLREWQIDGE